MAFEIRMPQLGLTMEEGTVRSWLKSEGDKVAVGEPLLEITTDKLTNTVESEYEGLLLKIIAGEGDDVPVKGILGYIGESGEIIDTIEEEIDKSNNVDVLEETSEEKNFGKVSYKSAERIKISPLAKKIALKNGIDYRNLSGSGPNGRIIQKDILNAKLQNKVSPNIKTKVKLMDGDTVERLSDMRRVVAERMSQASREIPSVTQNVKVDVTELLKLRENVNKETDNKYSVNDFVVAATAKALKENMHILVSIDGDNIIKRKHINIGIAVALEGGLIVPVIRDVDQMSLKEISFTAKELAAKARNNTLTMDELQGSTFSISNLGMFGVETFNPIINPPNAGILGVCNTQDELEMDEFGNIYKKQVMRISFTYDHRLIDGATAAKFELVIKDYLENPLRIIV